MRKLSSLAVVLSSSVFAFVACSSSSTAPLGTDDDDAGNATDGGGSIVDSSTDATLDSGVNVVDSGVDSGPVITGNLSCAGATLPTTAPASITVSGIVEQETASGATPLDGVVVSAFPTQTSTTSSANGTTDATGAFSLVVGTGSTPLDGYLQASVSGELDTYLYPNVPLAASTSNLSVVMLSTSNYQLLAFAAGVTQNAADGLIAVVALDCDAQPIAGATITTSPAGTVRYDGAAGPSQTATSTGSDGIAYVFNATAGDVVVSAMSGSTALRSHHVVVRTSAFTETLVTP